jgi:hypothetical protein
MSDKKRSVRGQVRRRDLERRKDASDQRIEDIIEELSTTESAMGYPFGVKRQGDERFFPLRRESEITTRRNWLGAPLQERKPLDPRQRVMANPIQTPEWNPTIRRRGVRSSDQPTGTEPPVQPRNVERYFQGQGYPVEKPDPYGPQDQVGRRGGRIRYPLIRKGRGRFDVGKGY